MEVEAKGSVVERGDFESRMSRMRRKSEARRRAMDMETSVQLIKHVLDVGREVYSRTFRGGLMRDVNVGARGREERPLLEHYCHFSVSDFLRRLAKVFSTKREKTVTTAVKKQKFLR